jgi:hypothetical protein
VRRNVVFSIDRECAILLLLLAAVAVVTFITLRMGNSKSNLRDYLQINAQRLAGWSFLF